MQAAGLRRRAELIAARNRGAMQGPEKQNAPDPENRGRCAFSMAYCLASSLSAVGCRSFEWPA
jgi:hypothetical protein